MTSPGENYTTLEEASQRKPIEIYHFWTFDESTHWRYTSADAPVVYSAATYNPAFISRGEVSKDVDLSISKCRINVSQVDPVILEDISSPQSQRIWAEIYKLHSEDLTLAKVIFLGFIKNTIFSGFDCSIDCTGFEEFLHRIIPKDRYQPTCNNSLFDGRCGVAATSYATLATVSGISDDGMSLTCTQVGSEETDYFQLGFIKTSDGHQRMVTSSASTVLSIRFPISNLATNDVITVYPGCSKSISVCQSKYSNQNKCIAFPFMPDDNPCLWSG